MIFKWKEVFKTNLPEIDAQHKRLFELGTELYTIVSARDGLDHYDEIMEVLVKLKDYTVYHFNFEEELMKKYGFEEIEGHRKQHQAFVEKIIEVENKDIDEDQTMVTLEIISFIANWIENHILKSDHKYKLFLQEKGII